MCLIIQKAIGITMILLGLIAERITGDGTALIFFSPFSLMCIFSKRWLFTVGKSPDESKQEPYEMHLMQSEKYIDKEITTHKKAM